MKQLLLILIFFTFQFIQAQTYYPIPTDSSYKWHEYYQGNGSVCGLRTFSTLQDTTLWGKTYHKPFLNNVTNQFLGSIWREENKRIYVANPYGSSDSSEVMIYDFNLEVGDTFFIPPPPPPPFFYMKWLILL